MMKANTIKSGKRITSKRLGRGTGSGKGTYAGRGMKGQKARTGKKLRPGFEGGQTPLVQRMPKTRGFRSKNKVEYQVVNVSTLNIFPAKTTVDANALLGKHLVSSKKKPVKLLGNGSIEIALTIVVDGATKQAIAKVEKAGGSVTINGK
jgi:large subunit ribosomal protein L15